MNINVYIHACCPLYLPCESVKLFSFFGAIGSLCLAPLLPHLSRDVLAVVSQSVFVQLLIIT